MSQEELEAGRPQGPPPGMMGGGMQGDGTKSLLDAMEESEDDDSYVSVDSLDTNGDGVIDAQEAKSGINKLIETYGGFLTGASNNLAETRAGSVC